MKPVRRMLTELQFNLEAMASELDNLKRKLFKRTIPREVTEAILNEVTAARESVEIAEDQLSEIVIKLIQKCRKCEWFYGEDDDSLAEFDWRMYPEE